jgi:hypothetical protein
MASFHQKPSSQCIIALASRRATSLDDDSLRLDHLSNQFPSLEDSIEMASARGLDVSHVQSQSAQGTQARMVLSSQASSILQWCNSRRGRLLENHTDRWRHSNETLWCDNVLVHVIIIRVDSLHFIST